MTGTIDIRPADLVIMRDILTSTLPPEARVWVFGSRATGRARRASGLDLAIDAGRKLTAHERIALNEALTNRICPTRSMSSTCGP